MLVYEKAPYLCDSLSANDPCSAISSNGLDQTKTRNLCFFLSSFEVENPKYFSVNTAQRAPIRTCGNDTHFTTVHGDFVSRIESAPVKCRHHWAEGQREEGKGSIEEGGGQISADTYTENLHAWKWHARSESER